VAIKLNLGAEEVSKLYREYRNLKQLYKLSSVYEEIKDYLPYFLDLFMIIKEKGMDKDDVVKVLRYANKLPGLEGLFHNLNDEIDRLEFKRSQLKAELYPLQKQIHELKKSIQFLQKDLIRKGEKSETTINQLVELERYADQIKNNKDYLSIEKVAEEKSKSILTEKKELLIAAIIASTRAIANDPNKQALFAYFEHYTSSPNSNTFLEHNLIQSDQNYLQVFHKELLQIAEEFYDQLLNVSVNGTMYSVIHQSEKRYE
jgi:chromosome segregation ATPase